MFTEMGKKIHFVIAKPPAEAFGKPVPNLHAPETVKLLRGLEKQHDLGILTDEEFEKRKQVILLHADGQEVQPVELCRRPDALARQRRDDGEEHALPR